MVTIIDIINSVLTNPIQGAHGTQPKQKICIVLDVSGSTGTQFKPSVSVLEKEIEVLSQLVLAKEADYQLYTFDSESKFRGTINVMRDEGFVNLPELAPGSSTNTHLPLMDIIQKFTIFKPDLVILFTDGQTNSPKQFFDTIVQKFKASKVNLEIIAVSSSNLNLETISSREENSIPGMDLINIIGNSVSSLKIYNKFHCDLPFNGSHSSSVDKHALIFMGVPINGVIPQFIEKLLRHLKQISDSGEQIEWGQNQTQLKKMICEIGKLLSVLFINFPETHTFVQNICIKLSEFGITSERVMNILKYGFECATQNKPIILTNFENRVKESAVKKNEFAGAIDELKSSGTTLNSNRSICLPIKGVCVINENCIPLTQSLNYYPKSKDVHGNVYFGLNANPQAIRIGLREFLHTIRFPNAQNSPSVIFYILNQMSLMYINGVSIESEHMKSLRQLAEIQTSMETMVAPKQYDGVGCFVQWKAGKLMKMNYQSEETHSSLYTEKIINPFNLSEPIWWALMMSMLGLFEEQKHNYDTALKLVCGDEFQEKNFLEYIQKEYKSKITGSVILQKYTQPKNSVITLDSFEQTDKIFVLKDHGHGNSQCKTQTWYSAQEIESYVALNGCVWCRFVPTAEYIEEIILEDNQKKLASLMQNSTPLQIEGFNPQSEASLGQLTSSPPVLSIRRNSPSSLQDTNSAGFRTVRINLIGITGSGKSTTTQIIHDYVVSKGKKVLIVSADKWSKTGLTGKAMAGKVFQEITNFNRQLGEKVIIVDLCNENGIQQKCFNYDMSAFESHNYIPNFDSTTDNFNDYEAWCLHNVLSRPIHSASTNYWLNPVSAGVNTCIKVHNTKAIGIKHILNIQTNPKHFNESFTMEQIKLTIQDGSKRHADKLALTNLSDKVIEYLNSIGL